VTLPRIALADCIPAAHAFGTVDVLGFPGALQSGGWTLSSATLAAPAIAAGDVLWSDLRSFVVARLGEGLEQFLIYFPDLARFDVDLTRRTIRVSPLPDTSDITVQHLLVDQVLPRLIAHDGSLVLHSAGVQVNDEGILLLGQSGRGKSTLAASFHAQGFPLLGDDAMIIKFGKNGSNACCRPLYQSLRLFPDSVAAVFNGPRGHTPVADYTSKQNIIDLEGLEAPQRDLPIRSIYSLGAETRDRAKVRRLAPAEACMTLVEHSFSLDPSDGERSERRLRQAAALAAAVPVLEISYPRVYSVLPQLRQTIIAGRAGI